jgi:hypothetical protein
MGRNCSITILYALYLAMLGGDDNSSTPERVFHAEALRAGT